MGSMRSGSSIPRRGRVRAFAGRSWTDEFTATRWSLSATSARTSSVSRPDDPGRIRPVRPGSIPRPDHRDVGIAEQYAVTMASGLAAYAGLHPVVAIYATFLNRAFDQLLMDAALHRRRHPSLDRAGSPDPTGLPHHGMWDLSICGRHPWPSSPTPQDGSQCGGPSARSPSTSPTTPTVIRFPGASVGAPITACARSASLDVIATTPTAVRRPAPRRRRIHGGDGDHRRRSRGRRSCTLVASTRAGSSRSPRT